MTTSSSCVCATRLRRWDPESGICRQCNGRFAPGRDGSQGPPPDQTDVRVALSEVYKEYADLALARGDREAYGVWTQAAYIAHDFVVRRVINL